MEGVAEINPHRGLPNHLDQAYAMEVTVLLRDQNGGLPGTLLYKATLTEGGLYQAYDILPMGRVGRLFLSL